MLRLAQDSVLLVPLQELLQVLLQAPEQELMLVLPQEPLLVLLVPEPVLLPVPLQGLPSASGLS